ncbi:MAG: SUMF1/EgtB/PvdO family nonheme iron enzyme [Gloeobacteraceae cyanobacterium ES-bin-144]|nr:SUMF1/EgtB/PvdO family nonheme iron enzyme [Verrucomicrobiales bacterium]
MKFPATTSLGLAALAGISLAIPAFAKVNITYVTIKNGGNANDPASGLIGGADPIYGAVAKTYKIAKNETTIAQYAEFLNAVAKTDTYSLYHAQMTDGCINGISQSGASGNFTYSVNPGSENKPITYVCWFDAARFCNWLHNGQPVGTQTAGTTESGAYTLNGAMTGRKIPKNSKAKVWIPSENEWYKAAYYDPNKGGAGVGGYWLYPNQCDAMTTNDIGVVGAANHSDANGYATHTDSTKWGITDVGAYGLNSDSAYGTNDQAGNVMEWSDTALPIGTCKVRGGAWDFREREMRASYRTEFEPTFHTRSLGFRVASVP